jgi:hypothetical protein
MVKSTGILILLLLLGSGTNLFSQELSHQVLVPLAGVTSTGSINYSQTAGETAVEVISSSDFVFTQGFQQPGIKLVKVDPPKGNGAKVYPNPVTDIINIELFGDGSRAFRIDLINISGTIVRTEKMVYTDPFWQILQFPAGQLSKGLYFVRIVSDDGLISRTFKIDKM